jgi:hypothetical protein
MSAMESSRLTCHIRVSVSAFPNAGIPDSPPLMFSMEGDTQTPGHFAVADGALALATFVASIDRQLDPIQAAPIGQSSPRQDERRFAVLLVSALTLFALAINGYHPYAEDGGLYMAGAKRLLDPALYPHSSAFVLEPMRFSLFAPVVAAIARLSRLGLPVALLALHLATVWATLFAAWMLAARCWTTRQARAGAVVLLACWLALPIAGTALMLMDPYLTARSLSTPCMVLAMAGAIDMTERNGLAGERWRGLCLWFASIVLAAAMHPLMAAYALGATLMLVSVRSMRRVVRVWGTAALSAVALTLAASLQLTARPESAEYVRIAMTRTYWFPAEWSWYELLGLAAPLIILVFFAWRWLRKTARQDSVQVREARRSLAQMAVAAGATAWLVAALFARAGSATHLVARMQPLRAFQTVYLIMVLALGAKLGESVLRRSLWRWGAAMLLLGGIMLGAERAAFPDSNHLELPATAPRNPWIQAFLWIRDHTPKDALFALDADYINTPGEDAQCFRAIAERSSLPDYSKDGGEASIAPELTDAWKQGQAAQQALSKTTDAERIAALRPLGVSWVVLQAQATTDLDCPYENAAVKVCRLD